MLNGAPLPAKKGEVITKINLKMLANERVDKAIHLWLHKQKNKQTNTVHCENSVLHGWSLTCVEPLEWGPILIIAPYLCVHWHLLSSNYDPYIWRARLKHFFFLSSASNFRFCGPNVPLQVFKYIFCKWPFPLSFWCLRERRKCMCGVACQCSRDTSRVSANIQQGDCAFVYKYQTKSVRMR